MALGKLSGYYLSHPQQVSVETKVLACPRIHCLLCRYCKYPRLLTKRCMIHLLTVIGLTPGSSSIVHIYTQTLHRTINEKRIYRTDHI
jgi:hypothetical protein